MFSYIFIVSLLVLVVNASPTSIEDEVVFRIINGKKTTIDKYPYQVSVLEYGVHTCGGSVISKNYVLTAGHCVEEDTTYEIRAGSSFKNRFGRVYLADKVTRHPNYSEEISGRLHFDVGLIRVKEPFKFGPMLQPIELFRPDERPSVGTFGVITGWGKTEDGYTIKLHAAAVPVVDSKVCNEAYKNVTGGISDNELCAGFYETGGKDTCQGDSGGPFAIGGRLAGVVSWGYKCAEAHYPGIYAEVAKYRDWVDENTKD